MKFRCTILTVALLAPAIMGYTVPRHHSTVSIRVDGKPAYHKSPSLDIILLENFNDYLIVKGDGKKIRSGLFKTNESTDVAGEVVFNASDLRILKKITIQPIVNGHITETISFPYKRGYIFILVYRESDKWLIQYTNREMLFE